MDAPLEPIASRPESLTELVLDSIRQAIVSRRLSPGERVTEALLARQLGVSKTPVREALVKLEYMGLIESDGGRGGRIATPSLESIRNTYEVRLGLETQAARMLAERDDLAAVKEARRLAECCLEAAKAGDQSRFREYDRAFHLALGEATGNRALARFIHDQFDLAWTLRDRDVPVMDDSLDCAQQHVRVVKAIEARSPEGADAAMRRHIVWVVELVLSGFQQVPSSRSA